MIFSLLVRWALEQIVELRFERTFFWLSCVQEFHGIEELVVHAAEELGALHATGLKGFLVPEPDRVDGAEE